MEIERIRMDRKMILGIPYRGDNKAEAINHLWDQFFDRIDQFSDMASGTDFYALSEPVKEGQLKYLVGVEIEGIQDIPEGMEVWYLMHEDYVVYPHKGGKEGVPKTFDYIYSQLLPEAGFEPTDDYDFEVYTPHYYDREPEDSIIYLCVPILSEEEAALSTDYTVLREELVPKGIEAQEEGSDEKVEVIEEPESVDTQGLPLLEEEKQNFFDRSQEEDDLEGWDLRVTDVEVAPPSDKGEETPEE